MSGTYTNGGPMQNNFGIPSTKLKAVQGLNNPYAATTTGLPDMGNAAQAVNPMAGGTGSQQAGGLIGLGSSLVTGIGQMLPKVYDTRVGMQRPNFARSMSDMTYTGMGAAVGGPWGALVGGIIDTGKNIGSYFNEKGKYNTAVNRFQNDNAMQQRLDTIAPDYTGAAKYGMKVGDIPKYGMGGNIPAYQSGGAVPVELEDNEAILMPQADGSYQWLGKTSANAPSHEQGGVNTTLPEGALVFPGKYVKQLKAAHAAGDWSSIKAMEGQMMQESNEAARQGKPFSTANGNLFQDGGMVEMAKRIKEYDPIKDEQRSAANSLFSAIKGDTALSQDDRDILVMGLTARIKQDAPAVKLLQEQYPDHYNYFIGKQEALGVTPENVPDQPISEFGKEMMHSEKIGIGEDKFLNENIGFGMKKGSTYYATGQNEGAGTTKLEGFDPKKYYSYLNPTATEPTTAKAGEMPTMPGAVSTASIGTGDRTATRHAAMKAGVYLGADGTPLTYWDDKAGKRMFTSAAKALDPTYVGEFDAAGKYKAQPKAATTTPKTTTATSPKGASSGIPTITLDANGEAVPTGKSAAFSFPTIDSLSSVNIPKGGEKIVKKETQAMNMPGFMQWGETKQKSPFLMADDLVYDKRQPKMTDIGDKQANVAFAQQEMFDPMAPTNVQQPQSKNRPTRTATLQNPQGSFPTIPRADSASIQKNNQYMMEERPDAYARETERVGPKINMPSFSQGVPSYLPIGQYDNSAPAFQTSTYPPKPREVESPRSREYAALSGEGLEKNDTTDQSKFFNKELNTSLLNNIQKKTPREQEKIVVGMMLDIYDKKAMQPSADELQKLKAHFSQFEGKYGMNGAMFKDTNTAPSDSIAKMKKQYQKEFGTQPYESSFSRPTMSSQDFIAKLPKKVSTEEEMVAIHDMAVNSGILETDAYGNVSEEAKKVKAELQRLANDLWEQKKSEKRKYTWNDNNISTMPQLYYLWTTTRSVRSAV
jgi:hypothetical protein